MHSRKSRTVRSYIKNARVGVGKVAETRDISSQYRSAVSWIHPLPFFTLPRSLSLSIYLSISVLLSRIITVSSTTLKSRGNYIVFSLPVVVLSFADLKSVNQAIHKNLTEYYVHLDAFRNADSSKEKFASVTTRLLLIYRLVTCGHRTARA